jgi:hypothetical protein
MLEDSVPTTQPLSNPDVMTESRRTILQLNIFKEGEGLSGGGEAADRSLLTDRSSSSSYAQSSFPTAPPVASLPPIRAHLPVPPVVTLITAGDFKRTVNTMNGGGFSQNSTVGDTLQDSTKLPEITSGLSRNKLSVDVIQDLLKTDRDHVDTVQTSDKIIKSDESGASKLFMATPAFVDKYSLDGSSVAPKKVVRRRLQVEEDDDSGGDDLSESERRFLRQCAAGQVSQAEKSLEMGVNVHVKNNFERYVSAFCC